MDLSGPARRDRSAEYPSSTDRSAMVAMLALAALPILCCGLPLLFAALVAAGGAVWLLVHGFLIGFPLLTLAAGLWWWRSRRSRC